MNVGYNNNCNPCSFINLTITSTFINLIPINTIFIHFTTTPQLLKMGISSDTPANHR